MEIGPITAIRPVPMLKPLRSDVDLSGVFAIEFRKASVITLKPAIRYQFKTGQRDWPKT